MPTALLSLSTAVPPHVLDQREVASLAAKAFSQRVRNFDRLGAVFFNAGIKRRYAARPIEWYINPQGWPERTAAYLDVAAALFEEAAAKALTQAGLSAHDVDTVVTVSSTGIATPSLEARVAGRLGFRPNVARVPVFGLGCAGGVTGLSIARRFAEARPGSVVLLVVVELCTLSVRLDRTDKASVIATALFGDGACACILRTGDESGLATVEGAGEHLWPDTLDIMGWSVDLEGLGVIFDRSIPPFATRELGAAIDAILGDCGLARGDVGRFVCHPGGAKVVTAIEEALELVAGSLDHEREIGRAHV